MDNNVNLNDPGFRIVRCDGPRLPAKSSDFDPVAFQAEYQQQYGHAYVPCDFKGIVSQAQFLINLMIILGVVVAMLGMAYAGYLYVTGVPKNIDRARGIFPKLFWGFIIMLTAWFIVSQVLIWLTGTDSYLRF